MRQALNICVGASNGIFCGDKDAVKVLMDALLASGLAMGYAGMSQPASGSEHHLAHFWDMDAIVHGRKYPLHGESVGVAAIIIAEMYQMAKNIIPDTVSLPDPELISEKLRKTGCIHRPETLGISRSLFERSLTEAMYLRPHYTILRHLNSKNLLASYVSTLAEKYYQNN
jgi:glycerol-1-phosphate dehydrogenase [NAD(P)+]